MSYYVYISQISLLKSRLEEPWGVSVGQGQNIQPKEAI